MVDVGHTVGTKQVIDVTAARENITVLRTNDRGNYAEVSNYGLDARPDSENYLSRGPDQDSGNEETTVSVSASTFEFQGPEEIDVTDLSGKLGEPQVPEMHDNDRHNTDFVAQSSLETEVGYFIDEMQAGNTTLFGSDLSTFEYQDGNPQYGLYWHDGTGKVPINGESDVYTSEEGLYRRQTNDFDRVGKRTSNADTIGGYKPSSFAFVAGDTFTGPVTVATNGQENAALHLEGNYAEISLGSSDESGAKMRYYEADNELWFGNYDDINGFTKMVGFDLTAGTVIT